MPTVLFTRYSASISRGKPFRRTLSFPGNFFGEPGPPTRGDVHVEFFDSAALPASVGSRTLDSAIDKFKLSLFAPLSDFESLYRLLQTERPVELFYRLKEGIGTVREVSDFTFRVHAEKVGEGLADENA